MSNFAIEALVKQRGILVARKAAMLSEIELEISDIETAIERLSGRKVWEMSPETLYDDQHPDYIKSSAEEI